MKDFDLVIHSKQVFLQNSTLKECFLGIRNGKIESISQSKLENTKDYLEAQDDIIIPGTIDPHVHIMDTPYLDQIDPEKTKRERYESGTRAAAAGGVTTVIEHPVCTPPPYSEKLVQERMQRAKGRIFVDIAFFGAAGSDHLDNMEACAKSGIVAFKTFLHEAPKGRERDYEGLTAPNDADLYEIIKVLAKTDSLGAFHAENNSIIENRIKYFEGLNKVTPIYHCKSRPPIAEMEDTLKILLFAKNLNAKVQICHISYPETIHMINEAKKKGVRVIAETCPQYLLLNESYLDKFGAYAKCNPPLRTEEDRKKMWDLLIDGSIDTVGSDHAPHPIEAKERGKDNIFKASSGFPGLETRLPLLFTKYIEGELGLKKLIEVLCENPARIFNLFPKKGIISLGSDADLVIINPKKKTRISKDKMFTTVRDIAKVYDGWEVYGVPSKTILRGKVIYDNEQIKGDANFGEVLKPNN